MYYSKDKFEHSPDLRDPVTGDWLPLSESDKARQVRSEESRARVAREASRNSSAILSMLTSILK